MWQILFRFDDTCHVTFLSLCVTYNMFDHLHVHVPSRSTDVNPLRRPIIPSNVSSQDPRQNPKTKLRLCLFQQGVGISWCILGSTCSYLLPSLCFTCKAEKQSKALSLTSFCFPVVPCVCGQFLQLQLQNNFAVSSKQPISSQRMAGEGVHGKEGGRVAESAGKKETIRWVCKDLWS